MKRKKKKKAREMQEEALIQFMDFFNDPKNYKPDGNETAGVKVKSIGWVLVFDVTPTGGSKKPEKGMKPEVVLIASMQHGKSVLPIIKGERLVSIAEVDFKKQEFAEAQQILGVRFLSFLKGQRIDPETGMVDPKGWAGIDIRPGENITHNIPDRDTTEFRLTLQLEPTWDGKFKSTRYVLGKVTVWDKLEQQGIAKLQN
jgi:hypothetical protein